MAGDPVYENDSLNTLADSRRRIKFIDEDMVTMASDPTHKNSLLTGKDQSRIKNRKEVDIFLIPVLRPLQVQKAISYHPSPKNIYPAIKKSGINEELKQS